MERVLNACDLNKDVEIDDMCQISLPDIQLKHAETGYFDYTSSHYMIRQFIDQRNPLQ